MAEPLEETRAPKSNGSLMSRVIVSLLAVSAIALSWLFPQAPFVVVYCLFLYLNDLFAETPCQEPRLFPPLPPLRFRLSSSFMAVRAPQA